MKKETALSLLGGSFASVARQVKCTPQSVREWPDPLPRRIADRVLAARVRLEWQVAMEQAPPGQQVPALIHDALTV